MLRRANDTRNRGLKGAISVVLKSGKTAMGSTLTLVHTVRPANNADTYEVFEGGVLKYRGGSEVDAMAWFTELDMQKEQR